MAPKTDVKRPRRSKLSGSVRVRGNSKSLMFTYGKRQYSKTVDASLTLTEARKLLPAFIHDIVSGAHGARVQAARALSEAPTWNECVVAFLADHMPVDPDGESKRHAYAYGLGLLAQELGERRVGDIKEAALRRLFRALHQTGRTRPTRSGSAGLSVATVRMVYAVAARMFRQLTKDGVIPTNPMPRFADLELGHGEPASERARRSALSHGQVALLIDACRPDPARFACGSPLWRQRECVRARRWGFAGGTLGLAELPCRVRSRGATCEVRAGLAPRNRGRSEPFLCRPNWVR